MLPIWSTNQLRTRYDSSRHIHLIWHKYTTFVVFFGVALFCQGLWHELVPTDPYIEKFKQTKKYISFLDEQNLSLRKYTAFEGGEMMIGTLEDEIL